MRSVPPPSALSTVTLPAWSSTVCLTIASPSPSRAGREPRRPGRSDRRRAAGRPRQCRPVVAHRERPVDEPHVGGCRRAPLDRVVENVVDHAVHPGAGSDELVRLDPALEAQFPGLLCCARSTAAATSSSRASGSRASTDRPSRAAWMRSPTRLEASSIDRTAAPSTRWRRSTGRSGRASSSMFARCAVRGVRSSCEASAISCCCACRES